MDSLAEKIILRSRFACSAGRDFRRISSVSTQTCLLMLKSISLEKLSKSMPIPEISLVHPTAAAAIFPEWVMLPLTDSGQQG